MKQSPKEKANELLEKYYWTFGDGYLGTQHKQCALMTVEEILEWKDYMDTEMLIYWEQVKKEIETDGK